MPSTNNHSASLSNEAWIADCQQIADGIRRRVLSHTVTTWWLSFAGLFGAAEVFGFLYAKGMSLGPSEGPPAVPAKKFVCLTHI